MAKQRGVVKLEGTLDDITFLKTSDGYMAKVKSAVSASRISSDPYYVRTRENNAEFARAANASRLLRATLRTAIRNTSDHFNEIVFDCLWNNFNSGYCCA